MAVVAYSMTSYREKELDRLLRPRQNIEIYISTYLLSKKMDIAYCFRMKQMLALRKYPMHFSPI